MNPIIVKGADLIIQALASSQLIKETTSKIETGLDEINEMHKIEPISIDTLIEGLSKTIDQQVISIAKHENLSPLGGEITASYVDEKVELHLKNYFEDANKKVILKESKKILPKDYLTNESVVKIKDSKIVYPILPPDIGS